MSCLKLSPSPRFTSFAQQRDQAAQEMEQPPVVLLA
jgi:hypothetical protein